MHYASDKSRYFLMRFRQDWAYFHESLTDRDIAARWPEAIKLNRENGLEPSLD